MQNVFNISATIAALFSSQSKAVMLLFKLQHSHRSCWQAEASQFVAGRVFHPHKGSSSRGVTDTLRLTSARKHKD